MAVTIGNPASVVARLEFLEDRIGYSELEVERNLKSEQLHQDMAEVNHGLALQWTEEKARCERERDELFGSLRAH